jgi:hypothetical protein
MSVREKQCYKCDETIYEIDGKMATTRDGKQFLQKWDDIQGTIPHYKNCKGRQETPKPDKSSSNQLSFDNKLMMLENRLIILEKLVADLVQQQHGRRPEESGFQE